LPTVGYNGYCPQSGTVYTTPGSTQTACNNVPVPPWHTAVLMQGARNNYVSVYFNGFGYGAYAPAGSVQLGDLEAWANPLFCQFDHQNKPFNPFSASDSATQTSGIPVLVRAHGSVSIPTFPHGTAYSEQGPIQVGGGAFARTCALAPDVYNSTLTSQINSAFGSLSGVCVDRTNVIFGSTILSASGLSNLFTSDTGWQQLLSWQQAWKFNFPPFLSFVADYCPDYFIFYLPLPPDGFNPDSGSTSSPTPNPTGSPDCTSKLSDWSQKLNDDQTAMQTYNNDANTQMQIMASPECASPSPSTSPPGWCATAKTNYDNDVAALHTLKSWADIYNTDINDCTSSLPSPAPPSSANATPDTLTQDQHFTCNGAALKGCIFYLAKALGGVVEFMASLVTCPITHIGNGDAIKQCIADAFNNLIDNLCPAVRVCHFADSATGDYDDGGATWSGGSGSSGATGFSVNATMTVPRGRAMKMTGSLTLNGDLWIQRGACLYINGDLNMHGQPGAAGHATYPQGRIVLEPGATLLVSGNLNGAGCNWQGSIAICGPFGPGDMLQPSSGVQEAVQPITSAIICKGTVNLPYGVMPSIMLGDAFNAIGLKDGTTYFIDPLLTDIAPNLAKIYGVFYKRKCWFAPTTTAFMQFSCFQPIGEALEAVPFCEGIGAALIALSFVPIGPVPGTACPQAKYQKNTEVTAFNVLTYFYQFTLNMQLGEYFYPNAGKWWPFGHGRVPCFPKFDPGIIEPLFKEGVGDLTSTLSSVQGALDTFWSDIKGAGTSVLNDITGCASGGSCQFITNTFDELAKSIISQMNPVNMLSGGSGTDPSSYMDTLLGSVESDVESKVENYLGVTKFKDSIDNAWTQLETTVTNQVEQAILCETPGVLVYGNQVNIGPTSAYSAPGADNLDPSVAGVTPFAVGLFISNGDLNDTAEKTVGCLYSMTGNINAATTSLYFYPYFTGASLCVPKNLTDSALDPFQVNDLSQILVPSSSTTVDITLPQVRRLVEGLTK
jgi:hypothetical protein